MKKEEKERIFKGIILMFPWLIGALVGPLGLLFAFNFDVVYLILEKR